MDCRAALAETAFSGLLFKVCLRYPDELGKLAMTDF